MTAFKRIRGIASKDFLEMTRDGRFRWSGAILSMLTLMSIAVGVRTFLDVDRQQRDAQAEARTHWEGQGEKNPHAAAHYGMYLFEPKSFLSLIDPGVESFTGVSVFLEAHKQNDAQNRQARDGTSLQRFGEMTAAMVLQTLVPLVIVFLAFPVIVGEREQGTLRFLLSQGVRPSEVAIGKTLGTFAALGLIILPNIGFGVLGILLQFDHAVAVTIGRFLALAGFYFVYSAIFLAIAVMASAFGRSSSTVLISLLGFWIFNTLIAPRLSTDIAAWAIPLPWAFEFDAASITTYDRASTDMTRRTKGSKNSDRSFWPNIRSSPWRNCP